MSYLLGGTASGSARGCALFVVLLWGSLAQANPPGETSSDVPLAFDRVPLATFVEQMSARLGSKVVHDAPIEGTVTLYSQGRSVPERERDLFQALVRFHGLRAESHPEAQMELLSRDRQLESAWQMFPSQVPVLKLGSALDYLTGHTAFWDPVNHESLSVLGQNGFVTLRRSPEPTLDAIQAMLAVLSAPSETTSEPCTERTRCAAGTQRRPAPAARPRGAYARAVAGAGPQLVIDLHQAEAWDVLHLAAEILDWSVVLDPDALGPMLIEYRPGNISWARLEEFARGVFALQGYTVTQSPSGVRYPRATAGIPDVQRMSPSLEARLSKVRFDPGKIGSEDLSEILGAFDDGSGPRVIWKGPCPRRVRFLGGTIEARSLSEFVGLLLESHDLVAREGRGGDVEVLPRSSCSLGRRATHMGTPHPALVRLGFRAGDQIVSIDGTAVAELSLNELKRILRTAQTVTLDVRTAADVFTTRDVPAEILLALLGG